jgi:hypothetical protein
MSSLYFCAAAALALAGRGEIAQSFARDGLEIEPGFRFRMFSALMAPEVAKGLEEGCRVLGLPE